MAKYETTIAVVMSAEVSTEKSRHTTITLGLRPAGKSDAVRYSFRYYFKAEIRMFLRRLFDAAGVPAGAHEFSELLGKRVRVKTSGGHAKAIGHAAKDDCWFNPDLERMEGAE